MNSSFRRICGENTRVAPVRDGLGILRFSQFFCTAVIAAILPLWPQLECGQSHIKNRTFNAGKPPKKAVFLRKVVRVTGFEPAASCSQSRRALLSLFIRLVVFTQTTRATNCANPGFLGIQFYANCGQTCGQADFLTTSAYGEIACISGVSRDCGHGIFRLEGGATRSQTRRDTNFAIPGYSLFCHDTTASDKNKDFSVCGHLCGQSRFYAAFGNRGKSRKRRRCKALRRFALPCPGYRHGTPKAGALPAALHPDMR